MIRVLRSLPLFVLAMAAVTIPVKAESAAPKVRIVDAIDETHLVALKGNTHPAAKAKNDVGKVSDTLRMSDLILVLSRDADQQAAFQKFVASQYDSNSPNFHQWLSPDQVGENFGPSQTDIATITNWLTGHGFAVNSVSRDRMSIRFGGTAAQVESTFHTEIHNLLVSGVPHVGNMSDPQIPAALSTVVVGVKALHNFFPRPAHHLGQLVQKSSSTGGWMRLPSKGSTQLASGTPSTASKAARPQFGISPSGQDYLVEDVDPWDFATIYNILPLWNAPSPINGAGQTIAVAGTSDINENDIDTFREFFGLPPYSSANQPKIFHPLATNDDPGICTSTLASAPCGINDLLENSLDVEWTGSIAPAAQIILVTGVSQSATDDNLYDAEDYIVQNVDTLNARIINVSYGECELGNGTAGNVEYYDMWQTAASEGISVFVAAGDSGSASCDDGGDAAGVPYAAEFGTTVSGLASTPYNTAVGGTDFNWCSLTSATECTAAPYWSATNIKSPGSTTAVTSALGYVPEVPWNNTCTNQLTLAFLQQDIFPSGTVYIGTGGQPYSVGDVEEACNAIDYNRESLFEIGDDIILNFVDTVGGSGGASNCVVNSTSPTGTTLGGCTTGATSTGATTNPGTGAAQASLPVVNNGWAKPSWQTGVTGIPNDQVRDLPDVSFFASDGFVSSSAYLICVKEASADPQCSYSTNQEPYAQEIGGTSVATPAMAGVMALINQKTGEAQGLAAPELYKLAASQSYGACSAEFIGNNPTAANKCYFYDIDSGTIAMPCDAADGSPNCNIAHAGDYVGILSGYSAGPGYDQATGLGSLNVANVVNAWPQIYGLGKAAITVTPGVAELNSSDTLNVTVTLTSSPAGGVNPTGEVTLTAGGSTYTQTLTSFADSYYFTIPANSLPGSAGGLQDTLTASYAGDSIYAGTNDKATVTVVTAAVLTPTITVTPASQTLNSGAALSVQVTVAGTGVTPTGTVSLSGGGYTSPTPNPSLMAGSYTFTIPANSLVTGPDPLTVNYSGDLNYAAGSNSASVTVTPSTFTLNMPVVAVTPTTAIAPGASATAVVTVAAASGYAGTVTLTCQQTSTTAVGGDGATCTLGSGAGVTLNSATTSGTVTFDVGTTAPVTAANTYPQIRKNGWTGAGTGAVLAVLMLFGIPARRRSWRQMLGVLVLMAALGGLAGCGGSNTTGCPTCVTDPGTTAGTYTFTVQATGSPSVTPAVSTTFTVTVN